MRWGELLSRSSPQTPFKNLQAISWSSYCSCSPIQFLVFLKTNGRMQSCFATLNCKFAYANIAPPLPRLERTHRTPSFWNNGQMKIILATEEQYFLGDGRGRRPRRPVKTKVNRKETARRKIKNDRVMRSCHFSMGWLLMNFFMSESNFISAAEIISNLSRPNK